MIVHPAKQGSPEWIAARAGIPTASAFERIMSPKKRQPSSAQGRYMGRLLAERFGQPPEDFSTPFMARGSAMEAEAVAWYEFTTGRTTEVCGLCLRDDRKAGASPDRLVGEDGLLEIKCVSFENHLLALLGMKDDDHACQCQGQMWITGRKWVAQLFYNPALPSIIVTYDRDDDFIADLAENVLAFAERVDEAERRLRSEYGIGAGAGASGAPTEATDGLSAPVGARA